MSRKARKADQTEAETQPVQETPQAEPAVDAAEDAAAETGPLDETPTPESPVNPAARSAQALIDASRKSGFPPPPAALKALNEETH